jgi:hypothetical protein
MKGKTMANRQRLAMITGEKAVALWGDEGWTTLGGQQPKEDSSTFLASRVAIVFRGMQIRANAVSTIPFDIVTVDGGKVYDSSDDWQNKLEWLPNPDLLFWLLEASWTLYGKAYLYQNANKFGYNKILKYLSPAQLSYNIEKPWGIERAEGAVVKPYNLAIGEDGKPVKGESIVALWMPDPDVEKGPPLKSPGVAALNAMGVLYNLDQVTAKFFKNGMLHTSIFTVPQSTSVEETDKLNDRIRSMLRGVKNAYEALFFNGDKISPVDIGGGIDELENVPLNKEKREDVAIALGIPMTKLFTESAAGMGGKGVSDGDDRRLVNDTALPDWRLLAKGLNEQVLIPLGYKLVERHEKMDIFKENRTSLGTSLQTIVTAMKDNMELGLIIARYLGINFSETDIKEIQALIDSKKEKAEEIQNNITNNQQPETQPVEDPQQQAQADEMAKFRRKAMKNVGKAVTFESTILPADTIADICAKLPDCKTADEVKAIFDGYVPVAITDQPEDVTALIKALDRASTLLEKVSA